MDKAVFYLKQAADSGCCTNSHAIGTLGDIYLRGVGVPANDKLGRHYIEEAAKLGDKDSKDILTTLNANSTRASIKVRP